MNIVEIIEKKKNKKHLTDEEINYVITNYLSDVISDGQMGALLMAICLNGMNDEETFSLTEAMLNSGEKIDLSSIDGIKVDKHSTGGVGDKTTLIIAPLVASCGIPVAKLSGRGLGHTGGTIDKLESIVNFKTSLDNDYFINQVKNINIAIAEQTKNLVPADKKIYALRSITSTAASIPLIASSIMSKKLASGVDKIVLDVKTGSGALIPDLNESIKLAKLMVKIGKRFNKETIAIISDMNYPLGISIGNGLEVKEAVEVLRGLGNKNLTKLSLTIATYMVSLAKDVTLDVAKREVTENLYNGKAFDKFNDFVKAQGGNLNNVTICEKTYKVKSKRSGYLNDIDEVSLANACLDLGSGKRFKNDVVKSGVGAVLTKMIGDYIKVGDTLVIIYYDDKKVPQDEIESMFKIDKQRSKKEPLIYGIIK
ncbi:MAG: thymidine phosphorylase [Bacilli bacterium]